MPDATAELRQALSASPDNSLLRMMLIRRLLEDGNRSEALTVAMPMEPDQAGTDDDRALLADLWDEAGLADRAAQWRGAAAPPAAEPKPAPEPAPAPQPVPQAGLRVVGGSDIAPSDPAETDDEVLTFEGVGGLEDVKKDIRRRIILPFAQPSLVARFRKKAGGGVLLYGPPGCGKTMLAQATAGECGARFLHVRLSDVLDRYSGVSEKRLSALFAKARESTPSILFFDEIEALASKRSSATASHVAQLVSHFLQELDGVDVDNRGVLVLAATNTPWAMDPAFLRPGRFDRLFFVPPPDAAARSRILDLELDDRPRDTGVDFDLLARKTSGFSGADLRAVVEIATDRAIDQTLDTGEEVAITQAMLVEAAKAHKSAVGDWLATAKDYATYANESGRYDDVLNFLDCYGKAS